MEKLNGNKSPKIFFSNKFKNTINEITWPSNKEEISSMNTISFIKNESHVNLGEFLDSHKKK